MRRWITCSGAARRLGVTPSRVRQLLIDGALQGMKLGRDWLIDEEVLDRYKPPKRGRPPKDKRP